MLWKDLEKVGVKRCCAMFTTGKRCRRRAVWQFDYSLCEKHGPIIKEHTDHAMRAVRAQQRIDDEI